MKKMMMLSTAMILSTTAAIAGGSHSGGHGDSEESAANGHSTGHGHAEMMAIGVPGEHGIAQRTVEVTMRETDDGDMLFEPGGMSFLEGETIRFKIVNTGEFDHEFVMDTKAANEEHGKLMAKFPEMEHDDPNAIRLAPGEEGEIIWTFSNPGDFHFACLIPGHMELGMHGPIIVAQK